MLFAVAAVLAVAAMAFYLAGRGRPDEAHWRSWTIAHTLLAGALLLYIQEERLPLIVAAILPNGLLVLGFGLRWQAAREFSNRQTHLVIVWGPAMAVAAVCFLPSGFGSFSIVFTLSNLLLAALATLTAWEFWRDRSDGLASRQPLAFAYALMAASFALRVGQGVFEGSSMQQYLPIDTMLTGHLVVALISAAMSCAFAISLAFERSAARLRRAAMEDELTGLLNRRAFETELRMTMATPDSQPFAVAIFDLDHFKAINDSHGHAAGDTAIRQTAVSLAREAGPESSVARIGGEEFAVLLRHVTEDRARQMVEQMTRAIEQMPVTFGGTTLNLTTSAGICHSDQEAGDFDRIMRIADDGLYAAKKAGRNKVGRAAA